MAKKKEESFPVKDRLKDGNFDKPYDNGANVEPLLQYVARYSQEFRRVENKILSKKNLEYKHDMFLEPKLRFKGDVVISTSRPMFNTMVGVVKRLHVALEKAEDYLKTKKKEK